LKHKKDSKPAKKSQMKLKDTAIKAFALTAEGILLEDTWPF